MDGHLNGGTQIQPQGSQHESMCINRQGDTDVSLSPNISIFPVQLSFYKYLILSFIIESWYNAAAYDINMRGLSLTPEHE